MQPSEAAAASATPRNESSWNTSSGTIDEPAQHAITPARRRIVLCGGDREWGRADSASTFRGHAMVALRKAGKQRQETGWDGGSGAAARLGGQAGSAADLTSLPGAVLQAIVWGELS